MAEAGEGTATLFVGKAGAVAKAQIKEALVGVGYGFGGVVASVVR